MKKNVKLLLTAVLMGTLFLGISGCGKKEKEETRKSFLFLKFTFFECTQTQALKQKKQCKEATIESQ